jgi:hypothetical protein
MYMAHWLKWTLGMPAVSALPFIKASNDKKE